MRIGVIGAGPSGLATAWEIVRRAHARGLDVQVDVYDRASRPDNILEAEKILGTVHIALGDNSGFGGTVQTPFHEDYVFYRPTFTALLPDGEELVLLDDGRLRV